MANVCTLDSLLQKVLGVANSESNQTYPPFIFDQHMQTATSLLIGELVKIYPSSDRAVEMLDPFVNTEVVAVQDGVVKLRNVLKDDVRNLLNVAAPLKEKSNSHPQNEREFNLKIIKAGINSVPIKGVSVSEWNYLTTSTYNFPTYQEPIYCRFKSGEIRVAPYDLGSVEVCYVRKEKQYRYGYIMQPDDTYIPDDATTIESEWTNAAFDPLFKALNFLFGIYTRDQEVKDWSMLLMSKNVFELSI